MCDICEEQEEHSGLTGCGYQHGTWECRGDGYLWDADSDGYDPEDYSYPCPGCNMLEFLKSRKEDAESTCDGSSLYWSYTGVSLWEDGLAHAREIDAEAAEAALLEIGFVDALQPADNEAGFEKVRFIYNPAVVDKSAPA